MNTNYEIRPHGRYWAIWAGDTLIETFFYKDVAEIMLVVMKGQLAQEDL